LMSSIPTRDEFWAPLSDHVLSKLLSLNSRVNFPRSFVFDDLQCTSQFAMNNIPSHGLTKHANLLTDKTGKLSLSLLLEIGKSTQAASKMMRSKTLEIFRKSRIRRAFTSMASVWYRHIQQIVVGVSGA
jgi:hypothetical protein